MYHNMVEVAPNSHLTIHYSGHHLGQHDGGAPHVCSRAGAPHQLRSEELLGAHRAGVTAVAVQGETLGATEVTDLESAKGGGDEQVLRLDVPVDDVMVVEVAEAVEQLEGKGLGVQPYFLLRAEVAQQEVNQKLNFVQRAHNNM